MVTGNSYSFGHSGLPLQTNQTLTAFHVLRHHMDLIGSKKGDGYIRRVQVSQSLAPGLIKTKCSRASGMLRDGRLRCYIQFSDVV